MGMHVQTAAAKYLSIPESDRPCDGVRFAAGSGGAWCLEHLYFGSLCKGEENGEYKELVSW
jgi:hypothetical protein